LEHWLKNIRALGRVDTSVSANVPTYAVFEGAKGKSYVAYNATDRRVQVTFSDGTKLDVEPRTQACKLPK
jgi:hypothetical protein